MTTQTIIGHYLPFEKQLHEIDLQIQKLQGVAQSYDLDLNEELDKLKRKRAGLVEAIYSNLTAWERVQVARLPGRPQTLDYIKLMCDDFVEMSGDRAFADDAAIVTGFATIGGRKVMLIGQHKGRNVEERAASNSGCPHPEGYRKALRKMKLAEKFHLPIVTLIDTKGAYPGIGAEERGQSIAIAENLMEMAHLKTQIVCTVIGEGGSGGALAIGVGDTMMMLEYAYYSVISPEGCASILWKDAGKADQAAEALKLTAPDLLGYGLIDRMIPEPVGSAARDPETMAATLKSAIIEELDKLKPLSMEELVQKRYEKLRKMGSFDETPDDTEPTPE